LPISTGPAGDKLKTSRQFIIQWVNYSKYVSSMDNLKKVELGKMLLNLNFDNDVNDFDWNNLINNLLNCNNNNISSGENKNTDAIELNKNQSNVIINNIIPNKNQTHFIELYP